jgi:hypothetical protein
MPTLDTAIEEAIEKTPLPPGATLTADAKETHVEETPAGEPDFTRHPEDAPEDLTVPPEENDLTDVEKANAVQLWRGLKDPKTAPTIIEFIAKQNGYVPPAKEPETPKEVKKEENKIKGILLKHLGPELAWLVDKLGPALEEATGAMTAESTKDLRETQNQIQLEKLQNEGEKAFVAIAGKIYGKADATAIPDKIYTRMNQLMDEIPPNAKMTMEAYITHLHSIAAYEAGVVSKGANAAAVKNKTAVPTELGKEKTSIAEKIVDSGKKGLDAAVRMAVEAVDAGLKKK